jgi:hypothetical protein
MYYVAQKNIDQIFNKNDGFDVAIGMNYGVASSSSCSISTCNHEMGITRIKITTSFFNGETPLA